MTDPKAPPAATIQVPIAPGELIDKITILEIKDAKIDDPAKLANVRRELELLRSVRDQAVEASGEMEALTAGLKTVNQALWTIEDDIRLHEGRGDFGDGFIALARSVYQENDKRAALKRQINELLGSTIIEEKSYAPY